MEKRTWEELVQRLVEEGILQSPQVIRAFRRIPRKSYLPEGMRPHAASDTPLPIGHRQTISAPHS